MSPIEEKLQEAIAAGDTPRANALTKEILRQKEAAALYPPVPPYGIHDIRFDLAWVAALKLGGLLKDNKPADPGLVEHIRQCLHPASVHEEEADESLGTDFPAYVHDLQRALEATDPAVQLAALGQACWDIFTSHPNQFSRRHLRRVWRKRPD